MTDTPLTSLVSGAVLPEESLVLAAATVRAYLDAVDDDASVYWTTRPDGVRDLGLVPPLAVAALALRPLAARVARAPGSLHTGQDLAFHRTVAVGETLRVRTRVALASRRRTASALAIEAIVGGDDDGPSGALEGKMLLFVAREAADDGPTAPADHGEPADVGPVRRPAASDGDPGSTPSTPGAVLPVLERIVTQERIDRYAAASGDLNPIHRDPRAARAAGLDSTIAHGMLLLAYLSTMMTGAFGRAWLETGSLKVRFRRPAPSGSVVLTGGRLDRFERHGGVQYAVCSILASDAGGHAFVSGVAHVAVV